MKRLFIMTQQFETLLKTFPNHDELLIDIEQEVLKDLRKNIDLREVISGTGGFTKVRVPLKRRNQGKSSSVRVIYFDCPIPERTFLVMVFSKSKLENISAATKNQLKKVGQELKKWRPKKIS